MVPPMLITAVGLVFAVLNGTNDGGALVAASLKAQGIRPLTAIAVLSVCLGVVPLVVGLRVAETLAGGLVPAEPEQQRVLLLSAVAVAVLVVGLLNLRGLPTSLTLALVGGIVGGGLGAGLPVAWGLVGVTALLGVAAPTLGGVIARFLRNVPLLTSRRRFESPRVAKGHGFSFGAQAIAYAANDGQKIYAVLGAGAVTATAAPDLPSWLFAAVPVLFAIGAALGVRRAARTLSGGGVLRTRPRDEVAAELSSALTVLGSAAVGVPVSMTQAVAGSLIGAGMRRGTHQVRWRAAARLAMAWVLTLPASVAVGAGLAVVGGVGR